MPFILCIDPLARVFSRSTGGADQGLGKLQDLPALRPPDRSPRPAVQEEGTGARQRGSGRLAQDRDRDHVQGPGRGAGQRICRK